MSSKRRSRNNTRGRSKKFKPEESPDEILDITAGNKTSKRLKRGLSSVDKSSLEGDLVVIDDDNSKLSPKVGSQSEVPEFRVEHNDKVDQKVDIIVKDTKNNNLRSLTIWGSGLGIEKTISVVEALKRSFLNEREYEVTNTTISAGENNEPRLTVILTLMEKSAGVQ